MENIENIFRTAETEKSLEVSAQSWDKLNSMLDDQQINKPKFSWQSASIAASFVFLLGMSFSHFFGQTESDLYQLQSLEIFDDGHAHLENIHLLNAHYVVRTKVLNDARMNSLN